MCHLKPSWSLTVIAGPRRITDPRTGETCFERLRVVGDRYGSAKLSLDERDKVILERTEFGNAPVLVEYHKQIAAVARIDLAGKGTDARICNAQRAGLADHASNRKIGVETIFKRALIDAGDWHDVGEGHPIASQVGPQNVKQFHHRVRANPVIAQTACGRKREFLRLDACVQLNESRDRIRPAEHVTETLGKKVIRITKRYFEDLANGRRFVRKQQAKIARYRLNVHRACERHARNAGNLSVLTGIGKITQPISRCRG